MSTIVTNEFQTVGDIRKVIEGFPDDAPIHRSYNEVATNHIFLRIDSFTNDPDAPALKDKNDPPGPTLIVSLVDEDEGDEDEEDDEDEFEDDDFEDEDDDDDEDFDSEDDFDEDEDEEDYEDDDI